MSVLIKGMRMPSECRECPFVEYYWQSGNTQCDAKTMIIAHDFKPIAFDGRHTDCPLVEVKTPHGRLTDADAFAEFIKDAIKRQKYESLNIDEILTVADVLNSVVAELEGTSIEGFKNAPTVIEAEEEQEE